jgi:ankyrin repeat protein
MSTNRTKSSSDRSAKPSVDDLVRGDVPQLLAWMESEHFTTDKLNNVLLVAASFGHTDMYLAITDSGRLSNNNLLVTSLTKACGRNHLTLAQIIFKRYQSVLNSQHLLNALLNASSAGHSEVVQWLLGEMKLSHDDSVTWLLATASARGDIDTVKLLTAQTASQTIHDTSHALRCACYTGRSDVINWLMANTASSVSKVGDLGNGGTMTSLTAACYHGHTDIVVTLLHCVTPHTVNIQGGEYNNSALHFAIWHSHGLGLNRLHGACENNHIELVNTLLYTDNVNIQANRGHTPLHCACQFGNVDIIKSLLSVFANTSITNDEKRTAVEHGKLWGNSELVPCFSQLLQWCPDTTTNVTTSVRVTQSTSEYNASIITEVTISDVNSRQQHERKRVSVHNTVKQRHNTYV